MNDWSRRYDLARFGNEYDDPEDVLHVRRREFIREPFKTAWRERERTIHGVTLLRMAEYFERDVQRDDPLIGKLVDGLYESIANAWQVSGRDALRRSEAVRYLDDAIYEFYAEDLADLAGIFKCDRQEFRSSIFTRDDDCRAAFKKAMLPRVQRLLRKLERATRGIEAGQQAS